MYHHVKKLMYTVNVGTPEVRFGRMLLEQFGGANGELAAALQYTVQGFNAEDPKIKDLMIDVGTEELSHLEVIGHLAIAHLKPSKTDRKAAEESPLLALTGNGGINYINSQGDPWTASYLKVSGMPEIDLRNNIAAEARAKGTYEALINFCDDPGTKDALMFLMSREIAHMKMFMLGLDSLGLDPLTIDKIDPVPEFVEPYMNASTGQDSDADAKDVRGPWNADSEFKFVHAPALEDDQIQPPSG